MSKQSQIKGNCYICCDTLSKVAMKNHIFKHHQEGSDQCYLIKAEGRFDKSYWLYFSIPLKSTLSNLDSFIRQIWCECCGHLSAFNLNGNEINKTKRLSSFPIGTQLLYEYDFGTTTEILFTFVCYIAREKQKDDVLLYARNIDHNEICSTCETPAAYINALDCKFVCEDCAEKLEEDYGLLPIVNSPRQGECGYEGELDVWEY